MPTDCLAACFVLFLTLFLNCDASSTHEEAAPPMDSTQTSPDRTTKSIKEGWKDVKIELLRPGKQRLEVVNAPRAVYELEGAGRTTTIPVVAIVAPTTGSSWVGPEQSRYLETDAGIVGFHALGGKLVWCESLLADTGGAKETQKGIAEISADFERIVAGGELLNAMHQVNREVREATVTFLKPSITNPWMFTAGPLSSQGGTPKIVLAKLTDKTLHLELTDQTGQFRAAVWIDLKTRKVTKVEEGPWNLIPDHR